MKIRVPATSANLGPGFDSCGIALNRYLVIEVIGQSEEWQIDHNLSDEIPSDEKNLLIEIARQVAPELTPHRLKMTTDIPVARGLGSSSSVVVAGIELANRLQHLNLTEEEKVALATKFEGHPDNVAPAICGDFVVASSLEGETDYVKHYFPDCGFIAFIPNEELLTKESRQVLPRELPFAEAIKASSVANVMIAAAIKGDLPLAGKMMEQDRWHEPYRQRLVPHLPAVRQVCHEEGGYGCFLSGAGPTVMVLASTTKSERIISRLKELSSHAAVEFLQIDREGVQVF